MTEANFKHPGTLMSPEMTVRLKTLNNPYKTSLLVKLKTIISKNQSPSAKTKVAIEDHSSMMTDGEHAYILTIGYLYTQDDTYAQKAQSIIHAWSTINHGYAPKSTDWNHGNGPLEYGWMVSSFARVMEILKYTWKTVDTKTISAFSEWLNKVALPLLKANKILSGNWCSTIYEARLQIAIFQNNKLEFDQVIKLIEKRIIEDIGEHGIYKETFRDLWHSHAGIAGLIQSAETAWHQGVDLFKTNNNIMSKCIELHAQIVNMNPAYPPIIQKYIDISKQQSHLAQSVYKDIWPYPYHHWPRMIENRIYWPAGYEVALAHYTRIKHLKMPETKKLVEKHRPEPYGFHHGFGTYTHYYLLEK